MCGADGRVSREDFLAFHPEKGVCYWQIHAAPSVWAVNGCNPSKRYKRPSGAAGGPFRHAVLLAAVFRYPATDVLHKAAGGGGQRLLVLYRDADVPVKCHGRAAGRHRVGAVAHHQLR